MMKECAALLVALGMLAACEQQADAPREPQTPDEMYAHVKNLLKPNIEHDESDYTQAMHWLQRAAEAGHLGAQTDLGGIYLKGGKGGVQADEKQAFYWFSKAAEQGSKEAAYYLGMILYNGKEIPQNIAKAREYWQQAADAGIAEAQFRLGIEQVCAEDEATVQSGLKRLTDAVAQAAASPATAARAACALGNFYTADRPGSARNMQEAARWYRIAADGGEAPAQLVYAIMLLEGGPVPRDEKQGMSYLRLAAGQDYPAAIHLLIKLLQESAPSEAEAWQQRLKKLQDEAAG